jgi:hypothetical protein
MSLYFLRVKPISRATGARVTRSAAYRAGERISDDRTKEAYNFSHRNDVVHKEIVLPSKRSSDSGYRRGAVVGGPHPLRSQKRCSPGLTPQRLKAPRRLQPLPYKQSQTHRSFRVAAATLPAGTRSVAVYGARCHLESRARLTSTATLSPKFVSKIQTESLSPLHSCDDPGQLRLDG